MKVIHKKTNRVIAHQVDYANDLMSRMKGLMFMDDMIGMDGLIIESCNSIHNCFVRFSLDVVFLDKNNKIVKIVRNFKPWRFSKIYFKAKRVLELKEGTLPEDVLEGDEVEVLGV